MVPGTDPSRPRRDASLGVVIEKVAGRTVVLLGTRPHVPLAASLQFLQFELMFPRLQCPPFLQTLSP